MRQRDHASTPEMVRRTHGQMAGTIGGIATVVLARVDDDIPLSTDWAIGVVQFRIAAVDETMIAGAIAHANSV